MNQNPPEWGLSVLIAPGHFQSPAVSSVLQTFRFFARRADFSSGEPRISLMARIKQFYP